MREPHLLTNLRRLFRTDGGVSQLDGVELGDMLWQLATHAVGAELALLYVLRQTTETQRQLNEVWRGLCPDGFTFADLQYEVERQTYNENDGDADAANLTEIRDELAFEACPVFMDEFDCGRVRDAQGNQIDVTRIPDRHMACVPSPKHNQEGWMITLLRRVRVCFRILCLLLFGPVGVTSYTDPSPRSLLQTANNFHTVQVSVVSLRLQSFLRQDARCPASGDERYRWIRQKIVSTVRRFTAAEELDRWYLPLDIWDRLKAASNSTLGEYAAPAVPDGAVNKSLYPAIAAVANRILGNRAWYSLVIEEWGLQPGEPFPWEQSVNVTEHTPEEAEQLEVERHARSEFLRVQQDMLAEKLAVESALAAKTHERGEVEQRKVVLDRAAAENLREKVAKIDKSVARAVDRGERKKVDLEADAALGSADLRDTIEDLTEQAKKLQRQLAEKQAYIDELPSKDDAESLDIDTLIKALKKRGLDVVEHVYTGEDVLDPASKQIEHTPTPSQSTEDFQEGLRKVLRDVAAVVPNPVRERMVRLASRATHGPDRALAAAIREGLQILPSLQPPTTQSTRRSKQQTPRSRPVSQEPGTPTPQAGRRSTRLSPASSEPVAGLSATTPAVFRAGSRVRRERPSPSTPRAERKRLRRRRPNSPSVTPDSSERGSGRSVSPDDGEEDQAPPAAQRRGYSDARVLVPSTSDLSAKLDEDKTLVAPPSRLPQPHSRRAQRNTLLSSSPDGSPFDTTEERGISPAHALRSSSPIPRTFHEFSDELIPTQPASQLSDNVPRGPARTDVFADPHGNVGNLFP
ncbi:hypothetical protein B0H19DRAFT_1156435 [Mycena capillaripes]|nr:hypothetical protein B0H19DRAFT_1156435 [Mycena capillaripes]